MRGEYLPINSKNLGHTGASVPVPQDPRPTLLAPPGAHMDASITNEHHRGLLSGVRLYLFLFSNGPFLPNEESYCSVSQKGCLLALAALPALSCLC